jgi:hypothetical protein
MTGRAGPRPEEILPLYDEAGVDLTLIRWMLSMTPQERLQVLEDTLWSIQEMRSGGKKG